MNLMLCVINDNNPFVTKPKMIKNNVILSGIIPFFKSKITPVLIRIRLKIICNKIIIV